MGTTMNRNSLFSYDFIEIGTCDFDTELHRSDGTRLGISVEPVKGYLDALPNIPGVTKVHAAISNTNGYTDMYSVIPEAIERLALPEWVRGCSSIHKPHPRVVELIAKKSIKEEEVVTVDTVPVMTFSRLVEGVGSCKLLKIDAEGHDVVILESYLEAVDAGFPLIDEVRFEANSLSNFDEIKKMLEVLGLRGYTVTEWANEQFTLKLARP
jgi:hypothetical protein